MPLGPSADHVKDPRYDDALAKALTKHGLGPQLGQPVHKLVTGTADPRQFVCCNSGCIPCVKDYLRAAEQVLVALDKPLPDQGAGRPWWAFWRRGR